MNLLRENLLKSIFSPEELRFLRRDLRFATALEHLYSVNDLQHLRRIGETVLKDGHARTKKAGLALIEEAP